MNDWNLRHVGLNWIMPCRVVDFLACLKGQASNLYSETLWRMIPFYSM